MVASGSIHNRTEILFPYAFSATVSAAFDRGPKALGWGKAMLLRSIRSRLLVLVLATVVPFMALVGAGLWSQWRADQAAAIERALNEARLFAAQLDDHLSNLENLLVGLSRAVSTN